MTATTPKVITIPANPELVKAQTVRRQLRVAAYCRVSTDSEEQLTSYEAQKTYYTDKIMTNPQWTMAGIFADEGITGTSAAKRPEFLRMIRKCRQKRIDLILVKSISRFARNTVDCLNSMRALKELGIAIIFEEQNINTLETDGELLLAVGGHPTICSHAELPLDGFGLNQLGICGDGNHSGGGCCHVLLLLSVL